VEAFLSFIAPVCKENLMWWQPEHFAAKKPYLAKRQAVIRAVRAFFDAQGFDEVETPALQQAPGMEAHLHAFKTERLNPERDRAETLYLHTSPEFAMKKLLVAGCEKIYQICHTFRNAEGSRLHACEFTMLEWYRAHAGYRNIMDDCVDLLRAVATSCGVSEFKHRGKSADPFADWEIISVIEAFQKYVGIKLNVESTVAEFSALVQSLSIHTAPDDSWDDLFFRVFLEKIEPHLGIGQPTILYDYPASMAALARRKPEDPRFAERFEVYVCGIELANAFGELTDAVEQRERFVESMALKEKLYGESWGVDEDFITALAHGMPESSGIALGIDRLAMLVSDAEDIKQVLWTG
jgi:lysyl-tRNA synthetase class 2